MKNFFLRILTAGGVLCGCFPARAQSPLARFLGTPSCASSSCHGGAGERRDQVLQWESRDVHRRAASTLNSARSEQLAGALGLTNQLGQPTAAQSPRCTVCHAPNATVPDGRRTVALDRSEGVACETCHGPAEPWLRSHTRPGPPRDDFTYQDKVAAGLRDLRNLRVRANGCVACHENLDRELLAAGHPELSFELDGQTRQEPRHWVEKPGHNGAQAWLIGQAVAWREVAWFATQPGEKTDHVIAREAALGWVVRRVAGALKIPVPDPDTLARAVAERPWTSDQTRLALRALADCAGEFRVPNLSRDLQARRAECLVTGLDRLAAASEAALAKTWDQDLQRLFDLAQSRPDFAPERFAAALVALAAKLPSD